ncbi:unnamed protein product [Nippostrongylus brasiliensis]|uniref:Uncharacterized protein n=1 Tax=Nippostrongylus brasiliensis TaxID=27835 RepID=A0A0N4YXN8_NIPBR|nr:unnamed protein product [Nippostrongylus brasiliensis]
MLYQPRTHFRDQIHLNDSQFIAVRPLSFFESVTRAVNEDEPDEAIPVTCERLTKFTFCIFNTDDLPKLLEEYSMDVVASSSQRPSL